MLGQEFAPVDAKGNLMDFIKVRVKFVEWFKDGNILEGREFRPGEVVVLDKNVLERIVNSGATLETLEEVIPNPLKQAAKEEVPEEPVEALPEKRKAGRPRKNVSG